MTSPHHETIIEALLERAHLHPERLVFTFADADRGAEPSLTFGELLSAGLAVAAGLGELGLRRGDRVLLCLPPGLEMVASIYGVLLAGGVCVPVYPPASAPRGSRWRALASAIARVAQPAGAIVSRGAWLHMRAVLSQQGEGLFTTTPEALLKSKGRIRPVAVEPADLAFIQFTSGTTAEPKGASIPHSSLIANIDALASCMGLEEGYRSVSWLPPYHDMGLIGHIFTPVRCGGRQYLLSARSFIERPARWLELISTVRATQTTAPNSAYEICARRIEPAERAGLDLSSLRWALNGAELVQAGTIERFCQAFEPCGFDRQAMWPVYGLAEATLAATMSGAAGVKVDSIDRQRFAAERYAEPSPGAASGPALTFVSVGRPIPGHELRVVGEDGRPGAPRQVGAIRLRGPSLMKGYFNNPEATAGAFDAEGWLMTGDLGYLDDEGALHVTGRSKELIIKNGRNHIPQDFEAAACSVEGIRLGRAVACGVVSELLGTEEIVICAEVRATERPDDQRLRRQVTDAVLEATDQKPDRVILLPSGTLPKTTSGKLRRALVKASLETGLPLGDERRPLGDPLVTSLRSLQGLAQEHLTRLLGWR